MGKKKSQQWCSSLRKLGKAIGRSHTTISKWKKRPDWPFGTKPNAEWIPADVKQWAAENVSGDSSDDVSSNEEATLFQQLRVKKLQAEIDAKNRKAAHDDNEFLPRTEVELADVQKIQAVKSALSNLGRVTESRFTGVSRRQRKRVRELIEEQVQEILREFSNGHGHD